jgi:hypothetical protein
MSALFAIVCVLSATSSDMTMWRRRKHTTDSIVIVSGLPRSGTSLMMRMLEAGGLTPMIDGIRESDGDNPRGYYEFERVKKLRTGDVEWLEDAAGKVVKVVATLLYDLPDTYTYRVVFMSRSMSEILASQRTMMANRGEVVDAGLDREMARIFREHLERLDSWLAERPNVTMLKIDHHQLVSGDVSESTAEIDHFLGGGLDLSSMARVVEPDLYRQRERP